MVDSMADELAKKLGADTDEGVISLAETFKRSRSREERVDAVIAFSAINYEKYSQKSKDAVVDALITGLRDKDDEICSACAESLSKEELMNTVKPKVREKAIEELVFAYENRADPFIRQDVILALGSIDYSGVSPKTKRKTLDLLAVATWDKDSTIRERAAEGIDRRGDDEAKRKVAEHWLPKLDNEGEEWSRKDAGGRRDALIIFMRFGWPAAAQHEISVVKAGLEDKNFIEIEYIFTVMEKGKLEIEKHEDDFIEATRKAISSKNGSDYVAALFDMLKVSGTEKSRGLLKEYINNNKNKTDEDSKENVKYASEAVKEIEKRIGAKAKLAADKIKKAMKPEEKLVTLK